MAARIRRLIKVVLSVGVVALLAASCGGDSGSDTTEAAGSAPTTAAATTQAPTTTAPTTTMAPTTTVPEATTTTMAPFDLASESEEVQNSVNFTCGWATDLPRQPNGQLFGVELDFLRLQIQVGEMIDPFLAAAADIDLSDNDALRQALAGACVEIGAPTEEYLSQFS